jgi:hypothetical protein
MEIEGFTYVRNGFKMGYPFLASIESLLPIVDKLWIVVGDSDDGTREAILNINTQKIEILDTQWDKQKRQNGEIFKEQTNIGLNKVSETCNWLIHLQADEVFHETAKEKLIEYINIADKMDDVDGLLFPFYHFWGDYNHIRATRRTHAFEIRVFKNNRQVQSYKDSQGFRKFPSKNDKKGIKLTVLKTDIPIYHYSYTRNPRLMTQKSNYFHQFWHSDEWLKKHTKPTAFDYNNVDKLEVFKGNHPKCMQSVIEQKDWEFIYDSSKSNMSLKDKFLYYFEKIFHYRLFEYRNYKLKKI